MLGFCFRYVGKLAICAKHSEILVIDTVLHRIALWLYLRDAVVEVVVSAIYRLAATAAWGHKAEGWEGMP
jgi:hypothetical protein